MKTSRLKMFLTGIITYLSITPAWANIPIDAAHFPDEGFREWMTHQPFGEDGVITDAEINGIDHLEVVNDGDWTVKSVKGIKYFPKFFNCPRIHIGGRPDVVVHHHDLVFHSSSSSRS